MGPTTADAATGASAPPIEIAVFWDYENTPLPREIRPAEAAKSIQGAAGSLPSVAGRRCRINMRRVYYDPDKVRGVPRDPSGLDSSGFDLVSTPTRNLKETVDKKLIVDLLTFAWEVRERGGQPLVVLITSDGDYSYTLAKLNDRGVMNAVMHGRDESTASILREIAQDSLSFEKDVLLGGSAAAASSSGSTGGTSGVASGSSNVAAATTAALAPPQQLQHQHQQLHVSQLQNESVPLPASNGWLQQKGTEPIPMRAESSTSTATDRSSGPDAYVFLTRLPKGIDAREVYRFLTDTYRIGVRQVSMEVLNKDPTGGTRFAHVQCSAKDADHLLALSNQNELVYKEKHIGAEEDAKPPSVGQLRRLPSNLIYRSRDDNGGLSDESSMKSSSSIGQVDDNIIALCVCLSTKQKSWGSHKGVAERGCWVPSNILQSAFQPHGDEGVQDIFRTVQDRAITAGLVETARHRLRNKNSLVPINLQEPTSNLSDMHYLRLTASGRACVEEVTGAEVDSFCSALFRKQKSWSRGTGVPVEKCWISVSVTEEFYEPAFPLKDDKGVSFQCKQTRDAAIASDYVQKARKDLQSDKNDFVERGMWDSYEKGRLSDDLYFQLTASGRRLAAQSLASTKRPSDKRR